MIRSVAHKLPNMGEVLGIELHPDVLPLSNLVGVLSPFLLRRDRAMTPAG